MIETLVVDELTFAVRRSARRRTLEMVVDRGGELLLMMPPDMDQGAVATFVRAKKFWLYTKLAEKEARQHEVAAKEYVSGEGFFYLGRSYRLLLVDEQDAPLKLTEGRFKLLSSEAARGRSHFVRWYGERGRAWLMQRMSPWVSRMGVELAGFEVRDLGFRWGLCGETKHVHFHWAVMLLPPGIVDYVIVHELAHLLELNHSPRFWGYVARALPDYEQRKAWLAEHGGRYIEAAV